MDNVIVSPSGAVPEDTVVTVTCRKPKRYVLMGEKYITCKSTGWINKPECKKCGKFQLDVYLCYWRKRLG